MNLIVDDMLTLHIDRQTHTHTHTHKEGMMMKAIFLSVALLIVLVEGAIAQNDTFRFANYYGDNMVLQRAPASPAVWGFVPSCDPVTVNFNGKVMAATIVKGDKCKFVAKIPPTAATANGFTITATSGSSSITLKNVIFGDVWVCGGQSNMVFTVPQAFNATEEMAKADNYPDIRLFTVQRVSSDTQLDEPPVILQPWSVTSSKTINGGAWQFFSATCWFFGKNIYDQYKVPLGLLSSNWGGTPVEAWSSPDALSQCKTSSTEAKSSVNAGPNPHTPSVLWNAMMYPLLNMSIYGAIWYQGEANAGDPAKYNCTFPAMINDWRSKWNDATGGDTDMTFPFGFVQLSAVGANNKSEDGFAGIRWSQTASYGYVPNPAMEKVFMAVAMDLGDPTSPFGSVHPRDKETVGTRLSLSGRAIAYGEKDVYYTGPLVTGYSNNVFTFHNIPDGQKLELRSEYGFEIGCTSGSNANWLPGTAKEVQGDDGIMVSFPSCPTGYTATAVRYSWMEDPCPYLKCAVYCDGLPSPPFVIEL